MKKYRIAIYFLLLPLLAVSCAGPLGGGSTDAGVVKTTNGGVDWTSANLVLTGREGTGKNKGKPETTTALAKLDVQKLVFEPNNRQHLFAVTSTDGIYFSENSADTWKQILSQIFVYDLSIEPATPDHMYAAGIVAGSGKVLETKDKGKSWVEVYSEATRNNAVRAIALSPENSSEIVIGMQSGNVIKSADSGKSWTLMQNFQDEIKQMVWQESGLYVLGLKRGLFKSIDGGVTFSSLSQPLFDISGSGGSVSRQSGELTNIDVPRSGIRTFNQFSVSPRTSGTIYVAANSGLYRTTSEGLSWQFINLPIRQDNKTIETSSVTIGGTDSVVFAGAGNTIYKSLNSGDSWQVQSIATQSRIQYILVDPQLPQVAYIGLFGKH